MFCDVHSDIESEVAEVNFCPEVVASCHHEDLLHEVVNKACESLMAEHRSDHGCRAI